MLILTGPTAAGKNTISHIVAKNCSKCAIVDFDIIRKMFVNPHLTPWDGEEGKAQQHLAVKLVCNIASGFKESGWEVIILDVVNNDTLQEYYHLLADHAVKIVQLFPSFDELYKRFLARGRCLTDEQFRRVYEEQRNLKNCEIRIDNTDIPPIEAARIIKKYL